MSDKKVPANVPFSFLNRLGHDTCAMDAYFSLSKEQRGMLTRLHDTAEIPDDAADDIVSDLARGGDGYGSIY